MPSFGLTLVVIVAAVAGLAWWLFRRWQRSDGRDANRRQADRLTDDNHSPDHSAHTTLLPIAAIAGSSSAAHAADEPSRTVSSPPTTETSSAEPSPSTGGSSGGGGDSGGGGGGSSD